MKNRNAQSVIISLLLVFIGVWMLGVSSLLGMMFLIDYNIVYSISVALCLGIFPWISMWFIEKQQNRELATYFKYTKSLLLLSLMIIGAISFYVGSMDILSCLTISIKYIIVAISEELLFRYYVQNQFEKEFSVILATLLQALIFALVLHSGFPFLLNLLIRVPSGIALTYLFKKSKNLSLIISIHFLYNTIIHILWL